MRLDFVIVSVAALASCTEPAPPLPHQQSERAPTATVEPSSPARLEKDPVDLFCRPVIEARNTSLAKMCSKDDAASALYAEIVAHFADAADACKRATRGDLTRIELDAAKARECLDAVRRKIGEDPRSSTGISSYPECRGVFSGRQADGQACGASIECQAGLTCTSRSGAPGLCRPPPGEAEPCGSFTPAYLGDHPQCAKELHCAGETCRRVAKEGDACGPNGACAHGLSCAEGRCVVPGPRVEGAACRFPPSFEMGCDRGLYCLTGPDHRNGKCAKRRPTGAECENDEECIGRCSVGTGTGLQRHGMETGRCIPFCGDG